MAKNNINISVGLDIKNLKKGFDDAIKLTQGAGKDTGKAAEQMSTNVVNAFKKIETSSSLKSASRQMFNLVAALENGGTATGKTFRNSVKEAGRLKDRIDDLNTLIQVGGPAGPFIAMNNAMKVGVGAVNAVNGAMALLGSDSKELQATMVKLQAGMAFAQGLKELEGLKDVMAQLNLVIKSNPLIAGAIAFTAIAAGIYAISQSMDANVQAANRLNEVNTAAISIYAENESKVVALQKELNSTNLTREREKEILHELAQINPKIFGQIENETLSRKDRNKAIILGISLMREEAKAQAAQALYVEAYKEQLTKAKDAYDGVMNPSLLDKFLGAQYSIGFKGAAADEAVKNADTFYNLWQGILGEVKSLNSELDKLYTKSPPPPPMPAGSGSSAPEYKSPYSSASPFNGLTGSKSTLPTFGNIDQFKDINTGLIDNIKLFKEAKRVSEEYQNTIAEEKKYTAAIESMSRLNAAIKSGVDQMVSTLSDGLGRGLGMALGGAQDPFAEFGKSLLESGAQFLSNIGKLMIAEGIALELIKNPMEPTALIIGGVAAMVAGGMISGLITAQNEKNAAGKYAQGGIVPGTSFSGDRVHAMVNSGEMVLNRTQQQNLFNMANSGGGGGGFVASTQIRGRDLLLVVEKAQKDKNRV